MKILVCYDSLEENGAITEKAKERAKESNAVLHLVTVLVGDDVDQLDNVEKAKKDLATIENIFKDDGILCDTKLMFGGSEAGESLVQYAKEQDVDEIIIGVRRRSKVGKLLFGSTAQYVILEAHCPVLTVK